MPLSREDYLRVLPRDCARIGELVAAQPLDAAVPGCPCWSVADLLRHLGAVQRWATANVTGVPGERRAVPDDELAGWFTEGATVLQTALDDADPSGVCPGFDKVEATPGFWVRRMAHETLMHRLDVEDALGLAGEPLTAGQADDGIDEVLHVFAPRQGVLGRSAGVPYALEITTPGKTHRLDGPEPVVRVSGPAPAVLLRLWRRTDGAGLAVSDPEAFERVLASPLVP